jgi:hypothetical protein
MSAINHGTDTNICDDTDIIARSETDLKKTYIALKIAAGKMGLKVNENAKKKS